MWDGFVLGKTLYRGRYTMLKAAYDSIEKREVALKIPLPTMLQDEVFAAHPEIIDDRGDVHADQHFKRGENAVVVGGQRVAQ